MICSLYEAGLDPRGRRVLLCRRCGLPYRTTSQFAAERLHRRCAVEPLPCELARARQAVVDEVAALSAAIAPAAPHRPAIQWRLRQLAHRGLVDGWKDPCKQGAAETLALGYWKPLSWGPEPELPRVAILSPTFHLGGVERWALDLVAELHGRRLAQCEVLVLGTLPNKTDSRGLAAMGRLAPVASVPAAELAERLQRYHLAIAWGMIELPEMVGTYRPVVVCCHGTDRGWSRVYAQACSAVATHLVGVSQATRRILGDLVPPARLSIIPNGVDASRLEPTAPREELRRRLGFGPGDFVLGYVGRLAHEKRVLTLCEAVRLMPEGYRALVVGDGPLQPEIASLSRAGRITLLPFTYQIGDALAASDAFVGLSPDEGFWYAGAEACLAGLPLITTRVGFLCELADELHAAGQSCPWTELPRELRAADLVAAAVRHRANPPADAELTRLVSRFSVRAMADGWADLIGRTARLEAAPRRPAVSILMSVYDAEPRHLGECWESIRRQTLSDWELVLVDDGSRRTDTRDVLAAIAAGDPRVRLLTLDGNHGLPAALNRGLAECRSDLVARMDADDVMADNRLELQVRYLREHPGVSIYGGQLVPFLDDGGDTLQWPPRPSEVTAEEVDRQRSTGSGGVWLVNHPAVTFRAAAIAGLGGYPEQYRRCQDLALWLRAVRAGLVVRNGPEAVISYRLHAGQMTGAKADHQAEHDEVLEAEWIDAELPLPDEATARAALEDYRKGR